MTLFDGIGTLMASVFGVPVRHRSAAGVWTAHVLPLREPPMQHEDADGRSVLTNPPMMRVPADVSATMGAGDLIVRVSDGARFVLRSPQPLGSPAADGSVAWTLEATR